MDELANQLNYVMTHFNLKSFIGFGIGAGGNILARFALAHPEKVNISELLANSAKSQSNCITIFICSGGSSLPDQLCVDSGWLARMGLSKTERSLPAFKRNDSRSH